MSEMKSTEELRKLPYWTPRIPGQCTCHYETTDQGASHEWDKEVGMWVDRDTYCAIHAPQAKQSSESA